MANARDVTIYLSMLFREHLCAGVFSLRPLLRPRLASPLTLAVRADARDVIFLDLLTKSAGDTSDCCGTPALGSTPIHLQPVPVLGVPHPTPAPQIGTSGERYYTYPALNLNRSPPSRTSGDKVWPLGSRWLSGLMPGM